MRYLLTGIVVRMPPQMRPGLTGPRTSYSPRCSRTVIMRAEQEDFEVMKRRLCAGLASTILVASQGLSTVSAIGGFPVLDATPMVLADDDLKAQVGCVGLPVMGARLFGILCHGCSPLSPLSVWSRAHLFAAQGLQVRGY